MYTPMSIVYTNEDTRNMDDDVVDGSDQSLLACLLF